MFYISILWFLLLAGGYERARATRLTTAAPPPALERCLAPCRDNGFCPCPGGKVSK